jgi:hypothetical protein
MKKVTLAVISLVFVCASWSSYGMDKNLEGSKATLHQVVAEEPGDVDVSTPYQKAINLHRLHKNEMAYWNAHSSKYIVDGKYAYLLCTLYKKSQLEPTHAWIAVTKDALDDAMGLNQDFGGGIAFYQLKLDGGNLVFKAMPYSTLDAMMRGEKTTDVPE